MPWTVKQHLINSLAQKYLTKHSIDCLFNTIKLKKSRQREELKSDVNVVRYLKLPVRKITSYMCHNRNSTTTTLSYR